MDVDVASDSSDESGTIDAAFSSSKGNQRSEQFFRFLRLADLDQASEASGARRTENTHPFCPAGMLPIHEDSVQ